MKIHQLPMGARFVYEGVEFVKSGPMVATWSGGQRLIPKYAALQPVADSGPVPTPPPGRAASTNEVLHAFDAFYQACRNLISADREPALAAAREDFLGSLGLPARRE